MSTPNRLTITAALAVALAASALTPLYADLGWLLRVLGAIAVVAGSAALARAVHLPRVLQPLAGFVGLAAYVVVVFAPSTLHYGALPWRDTLTALRSILDDGLLDVEELGPPVPTRPGLVLLAVLGAGAIAVLVDTIAVVLRRASIAGLPLLLLFAVPSAVLPAGTGWLPFVLAAAGWLGLLLADGRDKVSRWGPPLTAAAQRSASSDPSLGRVGRRIGAAALGVAVVVPVLVPGMDGRLLGGGSGNGTERGGARSTTTYNPITRLAGQLQLPEPKTLLTYRTDAPDYLRLTTLDRFDPATGWSSSELSGDLEDDGVQKGIPAAEGQTSTALRRVRTEIEVSPRLDGPWLPVSFPPTDVDVEGPWIWDTEAETVFSTRRKVSDLDGPYVVDASPLEPTPELLRAASGLPERIRESYARPPVVSDYVRQLVARTTAGQLSDFDRVVALQALFRNPANGFRYDEGASAPGMNAPDALENFLRGRVGFCEQYASAMAAMVRFLGIPARVAVGFVPGQPLGDGRYEVTTDDAHAWPEVWFAGAGWVRFEPTPREGEVRTPGYSTPSDETADDGSEASATPTATPSTAPSTPTGQDPGVDEQVEDDQIGAAGGTADEGTPPAVLLGLAAAVLVGAAPALLSGARRRSRWRSADPITAWRVLSDDAADVGHRWRPADSPRVAAAHLASSFRLPEAPREALQRLATAAERARYAPVQPRGAAAAQADGAALRRDVAAVRSALLRSRGGSTRWRARLLPPSALRWAASSTGTAIADALDRLDQALTRGRRRLRHPRTAASRVS